MSSATFLGIWCRKTEVAKVWLQRKEWTTATRPHGTAATGQQENALATGPLEHRPSRPSATDQHPPAGLHFRSCPRRDCLPHYFCLRSYHPHPLAFLTSTCKDPSQDPRSPPTCACELRGQSPSVSTTHEPCGPHTYLRLQLFSHELLELARGSSLG